MASNGSEILANQLLPTLVAGKTFEFPTVDLTLPIFNQPVEDGPIYGEISSIDMGQFTSGIPGGAGAFDLVMTSLKAHLKEEYNSNRISGAEYAKVYIGLVSAAMQTAAQLLLGKEQAYWQAVLVQQQAKIAAAEAVKTRIELETARYAMVRAQYEAATTEVNYALVKLKLATEDATYGNLIAQGKGIEYTNTWILPMQKDLLAEQVEVHRSQTADNRTDGQVVKGSVGKQKDLYSQQITSYQRDSELKAAKLFTDSWITQKTIDEGLLAPSNFTNANLDIVLSKLRSNNGLV